MRNATCIIIGLSVERSELAMKPKGEEIAQGIKAWMADEIKSSPSRSYELGRFLFGVSVGTVGMFAAIEKLGANPSFDRWFKLSLLFFSASMLSSLNMARPRNWRLNGETNLFDEHKRIIDRGIRHTIIWFITWAVGFGLGIYRIMS